MAPVLRHPQTLPARAPAGSGKSTARPAANGNKRKEAPFLHELAGVGAGDLAATLPGKRQEFSDLVGFMHRRGSYDAEQYKHAIEIERIYRFATDGLQPKAQDLARIRGAGGGGNFGSPMTDAYLFRFRPWVDELTGTNRMAPDAAEIARVLSRSEAEEIEVATWRARTRQVLRGNLDPRAYEWTISHLVFGRTFGSIENEERLKHRELTNGLVSLTIRGALNRYIEIATGKARSAA